MLPAASGTWARTTDGAGSSSRRPMAQESLQQKEELEKLEKAAEQTSEPEHIERQASVQDVESPPKLSWLVPYVLAAAVAGGALVLLDWQPDFLNLSAT